MDNKILNLSKKIQLNPIYISIEPETTSKPKIEQFFIEVTPKNKEKMLINLIKSKNFYSCIVFANTKAKVKELSRKLINNKINCAAIHGELEQSMRDMIMKKFKSGRIQTLIATDIVARGIDINNLEAVINYDIPEDIEYYIHRIGRTGRADASGESYIFMLKSDTKDIKKIEDATKTKLHKYEIQNL
ncbi:hypothetical protein FACS189496_3290 [Bacilli bacterium]|nr:hypothetical protein FACS189496_3290 [Bacilli bacterium]